MADERDEQVAYAASAGMAAVITDIDRLGRLEGELRKHIASTVELFRTQGLGGGNPDHWHVDLVDGLGGGSFNSRMVYKTEHALPPLRDKQIQATVRSILRPEQRRG